MRGNTLLAATAALVWRLPPANGWTFPGSVRRRLADGSGRAGFRPALSAIFAKNRLTELCPMGQSFVRSIRAAEASDLCKLAFPG
jgi:hypothetical protein